MSYSKSIRIDFSFRPHGYPPTQIERKIVPAAKSARYLGLHSDSKLKWHEHNSKQEKDAESPVYEVQLAHRTQVSKISLKNKRLIYMTIFNSAWSYEAKIWGYSSQIQHSYPENIPHKFLKKKAKAPWYVTNSQLREDLNIETEISYIRRKTERYFDRLHRHPTSEAVMPLDNLNITRRLRHQYICDLINCIECNNTSHSFIHFRSCSQYSVRADYSLASRCL